MATTITQSFTKLKQNLEISDLQEETVSTRQTNVREDEPCPGCERRDKCGNAKNKEKHGQKC